MSDQERFNRAVDALLADRSPRAETAHLDDEERAMLQMAQLLRGTRQQAPDPRFVERLHDRLFPSSRRISRRTAFLSGAGALAAGILAGVGIEHAVTQDDDNSGGTALKPTNGRWIQVATVADVADGAVRPFTAGAVQGFLVRRGGEFRAISRICTHMQCTLNFAQAQQDLVCPCHGARFDMHGNLISGPGNSYYPVALPPLHKIEVRVNGEAVEVLGA
jgi:nitrite reductase/ring-hydroxylating ferredoxin subunit